jgi:Tol biopolymer transport system component
VSLDLHGNESLLSSQVSTGSISDDGRYVVFQTRVSAGPNTGNHVYLRDRVASTMKLISYGVNTTDGTGGGKITPDGRYVVFITRATNLDPRDTDTNMPDIYIYDQNNETRQLASTNILGEKGNGASYRASLTPDGKYMVFVSSATNLVSGEANTNNSSDIFVKNLISGEVKRVSVDSDGNQANGHSESPSITPDGRYVVFESRASNLDANDTNNVEDVFVHDTETGTTERITNGQLRADRPHEPFSFPNRVGGAISSDGRYVVFYSYASDVVLGDTNDFADVFLYDRVTDTTQLISINELGDQGNHHSLHPIISGDGRYVVFLSVASNLVPGDANNHNDIFRKDLLTGQLELVSINSSGVQGNAPSAGSSVTSDGKFIAFYSWASNLVPDDTNEVTDVFIKELTEGDITPPTVTGAPSSQPNISGWHNSDVTINWTATDPEPSSGTPTQPPSTLASIEGQDVVYTSEPSCDPAGNCATGSLALSIDKTAPIVSDLALSVNPKAILETSELTVNASDSLAGVQELEYFIGEDPGQGNGADMFFDGTTATVTIGTDMPVGVYPYSVRAVDNAGNWSDVSTVYLTVYDPSGGFVTASRQLTPSLSSGDLLPGLISADQSDKMQFGATVKYQNGSLQGTNNDFMMSYQVGNGCQSPNSSCAGITVDTTTIDWLILGEGNTVGTFQGAADVTVDGTTTSNPYEVKVFSGDHVTDPNSIMVEIFEPGADPNIATPLWRVSGTVTGNVNVQEL